MILRLGPRDIEAAKTQAGKRLPKRGVSGYPITRCREVLSIRSESSVSALKALETSLFDAVVGLIPRGWGGGSQLAVMTGWQRRRVSEIPHLDDAAFLGSEFRPI